MAAGKVAPGAQRVGIGKVTAAQFLRWPRGFVWEGHPASKRQYVIIVSGRGEVDVVGGKKVQLTPGRVLLAEDVTGKGHTTRVGADKIS